MSNAELRVWNAIDVIRQQTGRPVEFGEEFSGNGQHFGGYGHNIVYFRDANPELIADGATLSQLASKVAKFAKEVRA